MNSDPAHALIQALPKAELHLHVEGTLEPEMMFELAARNGVGLRFATVEDLRAAYDFEDLQSFLDLYYEGMRVLLHERDFFDLAAAYLARMAAEGVRHVEVFFDPQAHTDRGVALEAVVAGLVAALASARDAHGITSRLIPCFLRHLSAEAAMETLSALLPHQEHFVAVGLDSSERGIPPEKFASVFDRARAEGFLTVAHAGEEGPPEYIRQALDLLGVSRIDHGVRCLEDAGLVRRLAQERIPLTVCPLSNVRLRVFESLEDHPLKDLMAAGLHVTVNSDDPAYFGGYLSENLVACQRALDLSEADLGILARKGFEASFLAVGEKRAARAEIAEVMARFGHDPAAH